MYCNFKDVQKSYGFFALQLDMDYIWLFSNIQRKSIEMQKPIIFCVFLANETYESEWIEQDKRRDTLAEKVTGNNLFQSV